MANRINLNQTSYHGAGAIEEIANEAKAHGFKKAFVCSDPDLVKFHVTSKVTDILEKNGLAYELYSDIKQNPTIENVQHGVQAFKDSEYSSYASPFFSRMSVTLLVTWNFTRSGSEHTKAFLKPCAFASFAISSIAPAP